MMQNDPLPETKKPVLIVSDGEEGNLVEKVIVEQNETNTAQQPSEPINNTTDSREEDHIPLEEKGS